MKILEEMMQQEAVTDQHLFDGSEGNHENC
jgi:hypothetical protein